jgi:hypothetical protein
MAAPSTCCRQKKWLVLREKFETSAALLSRQGALVSKETTAGRRVWAVRFVVAEGGRTVHRSIYVGADQVLLHRTRRLLEHYRFEGSLRRQLAAWARMLATACATVRRLLRRRARTPSGDRLFPVTEGAVPSGWRHGRPAL